MRIGEVAVGHFLAIEDEVFELVVSAINGFRAGTGEQVLQLHLHHGGVAAALGVFSLQHNHRFLADHHHVAGAQFLCDFHLLFFLIDPLRKTECTAATRHGFCQGPIKNRPGITIPKKRFSFRSLAKTQYSIRF